MYERMIPRFRVEVLSDITAFTIRGTQMAKNLTKCIDAQRWADRH